MTEADIKRFMSRALDLFRPDSRLRSVVTDRPYKHVPSKPETVREAKTRKAEWIRLGWIESEPDVWWCRSCRTAMFQCTCPTCGRCEWCWTCTGRRRNGRGSV